MTLINKSANPGVMQLPTEVLNHVVSFMAEPTRSDVSRFSLPPVAFSTVQPIGGVCREAFNLSRTSRALFNKVDLAPLKMKAAVADLRSAHGFYVDEANLVNAISVARPNRNTVIRHLIDTAVISAEYDVYESYLAMMEDHGLGLSTAQREAVDTARRIDQWRGTAPAERDAMVLELLDQARALGLQCPEAVVVILHQKGGNLPNEQTRILIGFLNETRSPSWVRPRHMVFLTRQSHR